MANKDKNNTNRDLLDEILGAPAEKNGAVGNNLNQYAKKANETGRFYAEDIADIKARQEEIWKTLKAILRRLSDL